MSHSYQVGDVVCAVERYPLQNRLGGRVRVTGYYRITAIKPPRAYVEHVSDARHVHPIKGWDNQWFDVSDGDVSIAGGTA